MDTTVSKGMLNYFKTHIDQVITTCKNDSQFMWNNWKQYTDPLIDVSNAVGVDSEELKRARDAYCNAQLHLMNVREAQIVRLKNCSFYGKPTAVEDLT
jgi:hypothetical protein